MRRQHRYGAFIHQFLRVVSFDQIIQKTVFAREGQHQVYIFIVNELAKRLVKIVGGDEIKLRIELLKHLEHGCALFKVVFIQRDINFTVHVHNVQVGAEQLQHFLHRYYRYRILNVFKIAGQCNIPDAVEADIMWHHQHRAEVFFDDA